MLLYKRKCSVRCALARAHNKTTPVGTPEKIPARAVDTRLVERHVFRVKNPESYFQKKGDHRNSGKSV